MKILFDTCTLMWWWSDPDSLSARALSLLRDPHNTLLISAASAWEIATKHRIGKFRQGGRIIDQWSERLEVDGFLELPISCAHAMRAGTLPGEHRDPFDRMIAAQALIEQLPVMTNDLELQNLGAQLVW